MVELSLQKGDEEKVADRQDFPHDPTPDHLTSTRGQTWKLVITLPNGKKKACPDAVRWEIDSDRGSIDLTPLTDGVGNTIGNTPCFHYQDTVTVVVWGRNQHGEICIVLLHQDQPCADDPEAHLGPYSKKPTLRFAKLIMGFMEEGETPEAASLREAANQARVLEEHVNWTSRPCDPYINPDARIHATWSHLYFVEIDLVRWCDSLAYPRSTPEDPGEIQHSVEILPLSLLPHHIAQGVVNGVHYRDALTLGVLLVFQSTQPWETSSP